MKELVTKFNLEAAFKALDEIEIPEAEKGIRANRPSLKENFKNKPNSDALLEDFYDVNNSEDLEKAQSERDAEIAQAKLARIEKIVDLEAESEEDLLPSYVGKVIIQCPQCMTLFYKNEEDLEVSEEDPEIVNVGEVCQHCGNESGYTIIGKVGAMDTEEKEITDEVETADEDTDIEEEPEKPEEDTLNIEEENKDEDVATEDSESDSDLNDLDLDLVPIDNESETENEKDKDEEDKKEEGLEATNNNILTESESSEVSEKNEVEEKPLTEEFDDYDKVLKKALPLLKKPGAFGVIIGYNQGKGITYLDTPLLKKSFDELKAFGDAFKRGKQATKVVVKVIYPKDITQIEKYLANEKNKTEEILAEASNSTNKNINNAKAAVIEAARYDLKNGCVEHNTFNKKEELKNKFSLNDKDALELAELYASIAITGNRSEKDAVKDLNKEAPTTKSVKEENLKENINILNEDSIDGFQELLGSKEFKTPISDEEVEGYMNEHISEDVEIEDAFEAVEELDEAKLNSVITESLTNVYENVESFTTSNCSVKDNKFIVEGTVNFKSGKTKITKYTFNEATLNKKGKKSTSLELKGLNEDLAKGSNFVLSCLREDNKTNLIPQSFSYKYSINNKLIEGISK